MAQEKARSTRARTKAEADPAAAPAKQATKSERTTKATAKKAAPRRRAVAAKEPNVEAIATHAYLMWERGEPGDATEHWLRAEAELRAA